MNNSNPIDQILNLINSVKTLDQAANSLKDMPVVGDLANQIIAPINQIKGQVGNLDQILNQLQPVLDMIPDLEGTDSDNKIKDALKSLKSTPTNSVQNEQTSTPSVDSQNKDSNPLGEIGQVLSGVNLSDGLDMNDVMGVLGNLNNKK